MIELDGVLLFLGVITPTKLDVANSSTLVLVAASRKSNTGKLLA